MVYRPIHSAFIPELDLAFLGMDVDVDEMGIDADVQHGEGESGFGDLGLVGMVDGLTHHPVVDAAAVHKKGLPLPGPLQQGGPADIPFNGNPVLGIVHRQQFPGHFFPVKRTDGVQDIPAARGIDHFLVIPGQDHMDIRPGQSDLREDLADVPAFCMGRPEELPPGWDVIEQIFHGDGGPHIPAHGFHFHLFAPVDGDPGGEVRSGFPGQQGEMGDRSDTGQGFPPETQGVEGEQVVRLDDLAGGMAQDGHPGVGFIHPGSVVPDPDELRPSRKDTHFDLAGSGIQGILHQFFHHGSWFLHHFPSSDLVGGILVQ